MDPGERKASIAAVFDRAADSYDRTGVEFFKIVGRRLVELAAPQPAERVLDLGCGRGASALPAAEAVGSSGRVHATDLAPGMVAGVLDEAAASGLTNVTAEVGDAEAPEVPAASWDVVLASLVLFFLPDPRAAVRRYRELFSPAGRLAFSWFGDDRSERWQPVWDAFEADLPEDERSGRSLPRQGPFSSVDAMREFLTEAGYAHVDTTGEVVETVFPDLDTFWVNRWSHGGRGQLEMLQERGLLDAAVRRVNPILESMQTPDGSLRWTSLINYTVAR